ncbi:serine/threonine dehydratase [Streptomyces cocklensis]|uniref:Threonine dehydratase n=1 Tax=Actinacidiphila cocklensis TaxID=887465 RepID=A0A9W4DW79_9ACTN|nr:serine/threonine dehydratase [Actinacidiphila cocklensis]MDD1063806.1 serine/threonine dehydratase [Actinacidiphila cocklensis]CAG6396599.1 Threonine dehydratase [Actinacidiphila cocklensis]
MTTRTQLPSAADVLVAADRIRPHARRTPLLDVEIDGRRVLLKLEHLQRSGSFKLRGALNAMLSGPLDDHIVTASGGNHGLAVATAASLLGVQATVYVPEPAPAAKARRIEAARARLVRHGADFAEAALAAAAAAQQPGHRFLHPYDDPAVVAGQGTMAAEIVADAPDVDVIAVAVGGGGLAAGTALPIGGRRIVAVEPEGCPCLHDALAAGTPVDAAVTSVAASATGATRVGEVPFGILTSHDVASVLVSDEQILNARDRLWEECRIAAEPAAAAPFAAWLADRVPGDRPCLVVCGANTDWSAA